MGAANDTPKLKNEKVEYTGKMFQIVTWEGLPGKTFEKAVRAPGARILAEVIENGVKKIVLTKEVRREADGIDYRLPGGKVFDSLDEYSAFVSSGADIKAQALSKAKAEAKEEAGIVADSWEYLGVSTAGASVDWDLHYFLASDVTLGSQELKDGEVGDIAGVSLVTPKELVELLMSRSIQEWRTADYLWNWLAKNNYIEIK